MTLFTVIFIVFIIAAVSSNKQRNNKINTYNTNSTSNAKFQYDTACNIAEPMAKSYRKRASLLTVRQHLNKSEFNYALDIMCKFSVNLEEKWLYVMSLACGFQTLTDESLNYVYSNDLWEQLPDVLTIEFVKQWKHNTKAMDNEYLSKLLGISIELKQMILNDKNGCYSSYINRQIINDVAKEFNTPTSSELTILGRVEYFSLVDLIVEYAFIKTVNNGYSSVIISDIRVNPTEEQQAKQYASLSDNERRKKETEEILGIHKKYFK